MQPTTAPQEVGFSAQRLTRLSNCMQAYIDRGQTGGILTLIERKGQLAHLHKCGFQDVASQKPLAFDHIFRIYSMTKPIVSTALMMLYEQAKFQLSDPIHQYLPEFKDVKVWEAGKLVAPKSAPTIRQLLCHNAGLTYGVFGETEVDKLYQQANLWEAGINLAEMVRRIAAQPLLYHPGQGWVYSVSTDVVGRLVEVLSGMNLRDYLQAKIFTPLGMIDTDFWVPPEKLDRLTTCYAETEHDKMAVYDPIENSRYRSASLYSGGGGLVSNLADYLQFARLVLNKGRHNGVQLLGRKTLELMGMNHVPQALFPLTIDNPMPGIGFGLGFSVILDVAATQAPGSAGTLGWGGLASTTFWVDPAEELIAILMTQFIPGPTPFRLQPDFRTLVYQAIND